jgi:hypothetical protein
MDDIPDTAPWPNPALPQMEINQPLLDRDYQPSTNYAPPNSGTTDYFPDDPLSLHQRFGPPHLANWLGDSGATSYYTPVFSDLRDVKSCSVPVSLADESTKLSTYKGTTECHFTTDDGIHSIIGLTDVYYVEGLSHHLLSLTALSCTQKFSVLIRNRTTTIQLPNNSTYTWPIHRRKLLSRHQTFSTSSSPTLNLEPDSLPKEEHYYDTVTSLNPDQRRIVTTLPLELVSRRLAHQNFRNLMVGSLHQTWNDHVLSPTIDANTFPLRISISQKRAHNKTPQREGNKPFHRLYLVLMRNQFRFSLGAYLQAEVIGRNLVILSLEFAYHFIMPNTLVYPFSLTKASMALSTQANTGILNFLNGFIPKVFSSPHLNHPALSDMTNTTNGSASFSLSMTCSTLEAMTPPPLLCP